MTWHSRWVASKVAAGTARKAPFLAGCSRKLNGEQLNKIGHERKRTESND